MEPAGPGSRRTLFHRGQEPAKEPRLERDASKSGDKERRVRDAGEAAVAVRENSGSPELDGPVPSKRRRYLEMFCMKPEGMTDRYRRRDQQQESHPAVRPEAIRHPHDHNAFHESPTSGNAAGCLPKAAAVIWEGVVILVLIGINGLFSMADGDLDTIVGVVHARDLLVRSLAGKPIPVTLPFRGVTGSASSPTESPADLRDNLV